MNGARTRNPSYLHGDYPAGPADTCNSGLRNGGQDEWPSALVRSHPVGCSTPSDFIWKTGIGSGTTTSNFVVGFCPATAHVYRVKNLLLSS